MAAHPRGRSRPPGLRVAPLDATASLPGELDEAERQAIADHCLHAMASIRRSGRRYAGRPVELTRLTSAELELVRLVRRRPGVSVAEAAQELCLAPNTVSTLVRRLTDAGLIVRGANQADRRVARLELTDEVREDVEAWRDRRVLALAVAIGSLSRREQRRLVEAVPVLATLAGRLEAAGASR